MIQIDNNQTVEQKRKMYHKLNKDEIIDMLIESNRQLSILTAEPRVTYNEKRKVMYNEICGCNPNNGGSGICGCVMANQLVDVGGVEYVTTTNITTG